MLKSAMEWALSGEIEAHLEENSLEEDNRRNGTSFKTVKSKYGSFELESPRDRNSSFESQIIKKRQTVLYPEVEDKILALYSLGTSYEDISYC